MREGRHIDGQIGICIMEYCMNWAGCGGSYCTMRTSRPLATCMSGESGRVVHSEHLRHKLISAVNQTHGSANFVMLRLNIVHEPSEVNLGYIIVSDGDGDGHVKSTSGLVAIH